ncbi:MAG: aminodeoxychorismate/anthranilate synthase component II [Actinomycetota bacterium]|nr:aminodeoxychorismate/anthranilate synthase component II [Actinomycetota bacterium]
MKCELLVIDNYDSFVYNLVQYLEELDCNIEVTRNDAVEVDEIDTTALDGIVISPGPCGPGEAGISTDVVLRLGAARPILGVCLGHQCIGHAYGGIVKRAERVVHGKSSIVRHDGTGLYRGVPNPFSAGRYHSLVVGAALPVGLRATAWTQDGILMGIAHRRHPVEGVQFHPESILTRPGRALLRNFVRRCGQWPVAKA